MGIYPILMDHLKAARPFSDLTFNLKVKGPRKTEDNYNDGTVGQWVSAVSCAASNYSVIET